MDKKTVFFKLETKIKEGHFGRPEYSPVVFFYENPAIEIVLKASEQASSEIIVEANTQRKANEKVEAVLSGLIQGRYDDPAFREEFEIRMKSEGKNHYTIPFDMLPLNAVEFVHAIHTELSAASKDTYKAIRWFENIEGSNRFFSGIKFSFSLDRITWKEFPGAIKGEVHIRPGLHIIEPIRQKINEMVQLGKTEPIAHELLREAKSLSTSYPRSALLIGIASAETAVKQCIVTLKPDTKWLIEKLPSPDIIKLLSEYFSDLTQNLKTEKLSPIPKPMLESLRKYIGMRNIIAHGGVVAIRDEHIKEMLSLVSDLLWILDIYGGNLWALEHISDSTRTQMGLPLKYPEE